MPAPAAVSRARVGSQTSVALEYQRHIHRASVLVRTDPTLSLSGSLVCRVVPAGERMRVVLEHAQLPHTQVDVPWPLIPGVYTALFDDGFVVTLPATPQPARAVFSASWLQSWHACASLQCVRCAAVLVDFPTHANLRALPSESWEELVDAWMCHGDQKLNTSVTRGRESVGAARIPAASDVWVGSFLVKTSSAHLRRGAVHVSPAKQSTCWEVRVLWPCQTG